MLVIYIRLGANGKLKAEYGGITIDEVSREEIDEYISNFPVVIPVDFE